MYTMNGLIYSSHVVYEGMLSWSCGEEGVMPEEAGVRRDSCTCR